MEIDRVLVSTEQIHLRLGELAREIAQSSVEQELVLVGVLQGAFIFLADLLRLLPATVSMDFIAASSYGPSAQSSGDVRITLDLKSSVAGKDVVLVEDIVDTGLTLQALYRHLENHRPRTVRSCTLLSKPSRRIVPIEADWVGFEIPDEFVVGYGLDYAEQFRGLPYIATIELE